MKIAFVSQPGHAVTPASGSIELWADEIARRLAERHEVCIYASRPPVPSEAPDGSVEYRFVPHDAARTLTRAARRAWRLLPDDRPFFASKLHPLEYWARIARDVRRSGADIVHVFNYSQALPILRAATDAKLVLHMHCEWLTQLDGRMIDRRLRHADRIVGCSEYITDKVRSRFPQHASRCTTIYNGVEAHAEASPRRRGVGAPIRLLNVGRVSPEKGLHVLVDALERVVPGHPEIELTVLGEESPVPFEFAVGISQDDLVKDLARFYEGSYHAHLRGRVSHAVAERVTWVDRVSHDATTAFYADADIFVFPSIFEAFPIPPIEAMAAGLPVIASKAGGVVESVVHERTGLLVERDDASGLADAILRLARNGAERRAMGEAGRERVTALYSWHRIVEGLEAEFTRLLEPSAAPVARSDEALGLD
jgi:glycosyltransferase involved in cell wall biosynthesis